MSDEDIPCLSDYGTECIRWRYTMCQTRACYVSDKYTLCLSDEDKLVCVVHPSVGHPETGVCHVTVSAHMVLSWAPTVL